MILLVTGILIHFTTSRGNWRVNERLLWLRFTINRDLYKASVLLLLQVSDINIMTLAAQKNCGLCLLMVYFSLLTPGCLLSYN